MELVQEFVVPRPIDAAWAVLTDVERIAPCMPGAQLTEVDGETYRGLVKVRVGPVVANFAGQAVFRERDEKAHRVVLEARGKEARGQGLASALITAELTDEGEQTRVNVVTELVISGKLAQFGRGAMAEISGKLLGQFVDCLESTVLAEQAPAPSTPASMTSAPAAETPAAETPAAETPAAAAPDTGAAAEDDVTPTGRRIDSPEAEPVDLLRTAGAPILKRLIPTLIVVAAIVVALVLIIS